ncbi:MAG: GNAT family N-acetyltransferase [Microbacteriaceae bacterium]|nr:GNAT family N-acetyltransferase [Microbacteriaceae bacterium]MCL2794059.1 GNAT family N-acetyltransferase [Microbacteriaceae bacterium]
MAEITIDEATEFSDELADAIEKLLPELSSTAVYDRELVKEIVASEATHLYLARLDGRIVGTASLCVVPIPTGRRAHVEDVVVDESARGHGLSRRLLEHLVTEANERFGVRTIDLTSRPDREAANHLYRTGGFVQRNTNVYRWDAAAAAAQKKG